ncbi:viroplasmin family protein [Neobacillus sp. PS3-12]|uniref:ribonuclease H1 domain-containing protein n=1 Tax=Neobacillus sp. PS3-12 TaxID=3070677 RepID=UPI0027DFF91B|nr:viroplasmin family protein [Neobacillus sp. PS3-12]WML51700.1 viroplasmin family protein [Neobacillus sp. PS3-12]
MSKFYAVKVGRRPGIYMTWAETEEQVKGFSGAIYKSFKTNKEAQKFFDNNSKSVLNEVHTGNIQAVVEQEEIHKSPTQTSEFSITEQHNSIEIYVDGSYSHTPPIYGSGWVAVKENDVLKKKSFSGNDERYIESRQVPGEVFACIDAINWAKESGYEHVIISYDYEGIEKWAKRDWAAKKNISKDYVTLFDNASRGITVTFNKVKAHSSINFNEIADKLAKGALLKKGIRSNKDGGITIYGIDREELELIFDLIQSENPNFKLYTNTERQGCINFTLTSDDYRVVINCYDTGRTVVQGKDSPFMQYTLTLLLQLCENEDDVVETLNAFNMVTINPQIVEDRFNEVLPNYRHTSNKLDMSLKQAAYNLTISGVRYDYSDLPMPILRAIDYYLHGIFKSIGLITVTSSGKNNFGFFVADSDDNYLLQTAHAEKFGDERKVAFVNKLYNFYHKNRHTLFHWDEEPEDTRVLSSIEEARDIILDGFTLLDEYYIIF